MAEIGIQNPIHQNPTRISTKKKKLNRTKRLRLAVELSEQIGRLAELFPQPLGEQPASVHAQINGCR